MRSGPVGTTRLQHCATQHHDPLFQNDKLTADARIRTNGSDRAREMKCLCSHSSRPRATHRYLAASCYAMPCCVVLHRSNVKKKKKKTSKNIHVTILVIDENYEILLVLFDLENAENLLHEMRRRRNTHEAQLYRINH